MSDNPTDKEVYKALFAQLIMSLSSSAMQQLGKLVDPATRKAEVDLEGAQMTIDMLSMLDEKTRGNLDKDEEGMLRSILSSLQMNYVETMESTPPPAKAAAGFAVPPAEHAAPDNAGAPPPPAKDAKFHKSYGGD